MTDISKEALDRGKAKVLELVPDAAKVEIMVSLLPCPLPRFPANPAGLRRLEGRPSQGRGRLPRPLGRY
jgi:hypothetical protein